MMILRIMMVLLSAMMTMVVQVMLWLNSGLLKLWVMAHKWVPEPSHVGRKNAACKSIITVRTSSSLATHIKGPLYDNDYFTSSNWRYVVSMNESLSCPRKNGSVCMMIAWFSFSLATNHTCTSCTVVKQSDMVRLFVIQLNFASRINSWNPFFA